MDDRRATLRSLRLIRVVALADFALLVPLVIASLRHAEGLVSVLGPIHGAGFLVLLGLCLRGWMLDRWGWWFPLLVVVTLGPPGSLYGEWRVRRGLGEASASAR
jgi:hypothetical protein